MNFTAYPIGPPISNSVEYDVMPGDTLQDVIDGLQALFPITGFDAISTSDVENYVPPLSIMVFEANGGSTGFIPIDASFTITYSGGVPVNDINIAAFKHRARYSFALAYFDQFGETDGAHYQPSSMTLVMPELDTTGGLQPKIPQITFQINHQPPIWATNFAWVRTTNLTFLFS